MNLQINQTYNFNTLAPALLGAKYTAAKLIGIFDYKTALGYINPDAVNANVYPLLPTGTSSDVSAYTFLRFQTASDATVVFALEWLDPNSVVQVSSTAVTVKINNAGSADMAKIRQVLSVLGYTSISLTLSTS